MESLDYKFKSFVNGIVAIFLEITVYGVVVLFKGCILSR